MAQRSALGSRSLASQSRNFDLPNDDELGIGGGFDPYVGFGHVAGTGPNNQGGYAPARTASPPLGAAPGLHYQQDSIASSSQATSAHGAGGSGRAGHLPRYSAGSYEPLLANFSENASSSPTTPGEEAAGSTPPPPPPHNTMRAVDKAERSRENVSGDTDDIGEDGMPDARLVPGLERPVLGRRSQSLRDDVDYSRPVLEVRNVVDDEHDD
ncbi:hypothetical protein EWM64_g3069 [Hericium alpestre]|uniref:Uncharacterized protein n=1 Tax=Hericium alpestre TaxID=135208 RepID=A0A4Z0A4W7_9AGAM|nr:hypothetical protein EWM64_g3069 [Hericium alpestre]